MKVLVCGGRDYTNYGHLVRRLDELHYGPRGPITLIIHGGQRGADTMAEGWAINRNIHSIPVKAEWGYGGIAGRMRNAKMLRDQRPDLIIAFAGGRGTEDMVSRAVAAGIEARVLR